MIPIIISIKLTFLRLVIGKIKNANNRAKPKWIALAGKPLNIPKSKINGNGDAYQSWKNDQTIAIAETIFRWKPVSLFVGERSSSIFACTLVLTGWFICKSYTNKKKGPI